MKIRLFLISLLLTVVSQVSSADELSSRKTQRFIKDFYKALEARDYHKLNTMIADTATINIHLSKMNQGFSLNKNQYLQQIKATWHFGHDEQYKLSDTKYTLTQAGSSANVQFHVSESRIILDEKLSQEQDLNMELALVDEQLKISSLKAKTNF